MLTKICIHCNVEKPLSDFHKDKYKLHGVRNDCKKCRKIITSEYYQDNKEWIKEKVIQYRDENPDKVKLWTKISEERRKEDIIKYRKEWYLRNREHKLQSGKNWDKLNPNIRREISNNWVYNHPDKVNARCSRRRASKMKAVPKWADLDKIKEFYKLAKELEMKDGIKRHVDHIIPLTHQLVCGLHVENNLQILTEEENCKKNNSFEPIIESFSDNDMVLSV